MFFLLFTIYPHFFFLPITTWLFSGIWVVADQLSIIFTSYFLAQTYFDKLLTQFYTKIDHDWIILYKTN